MSEKPTVCPFCGGEPIANPPNKHGKHTIRCISCSAEGGWSTSAAGAIKLWNMRMNTDLLAEREAHRKLREKHEILWKNYDELREADDE